LEVVVVVNLYSDVKKILFCIWSLFALLNNIGCSDEGSTASDEMLKELSKLEFAVYPGAENIEEYSLKKGYIRGVTYKVKLRYPAQQVLEFYEKEMKLLGFQPFIEDYYKYADRHWQSYIDSTLKGEPYVAKLNADWVDTAKIKRVSLILEYYWYDKDLSSKIVLTDADNLNVIIQIMPHFTLPPPK